MTTLLKAYYDGTVFVPIIPVDIQTGKVLVMSILHENAPTSHAVNQIKEFKQITNNLKKINNIEPLPAEFDEILLERIHLTPSILPKYPN